MFYVGKYLFIPEQQISNNCENYYIPTSYGENIYYKKGDKSQKSERCSYWCRDASTVVTKKLESL